MNLIGCISINHKHAPVELREQIHIDPDDILPIMGRFSEAYTLNTCNRIEVYWRELKSAAMYAHLSSLSGISQEKLQEVSEYFIGRDAIRHLFMVASGLDSLVIGEPQILGQIKDSYRDCRSVNITGTFLNKALHRSFRTAKRIRTETDIGRYSVSVASEAVELACHIFGDISASTALIIGAGDMASIAARRLKDRGVTKINIINRTHRVACDLAYELGGIPKPFESLKDELVSCDIVISSTGSPTPIITRDMVESVMKLRRNSPIFIIDIAVPRDVDPNAGKCYNCYLYDIDSLNAIVDRHFEHRQEQAQKALGIIDQEVVKYEKWIDALDAQTTIKDLFDLLEVHIHEQIEELQLDDQEKNIVEKTLRKSLKRFIHRPVSFLKSHPGINHIEQTRRIFQLDEDYQDRHKR
jgi:glutamyl-tRNA reductase